MDTQRFVALVKAAPAGSRWVIRYNLAKNHGFSTYCGTPSPANPPLSDALGYIAKHTPEYVILRTRSADTAIRYTALVLAKPVPAPPQRKRARE